MKDRASIISGSGETSRNYHLSMNKKKCRSAVFSFEREEVPRCGIDCSFLRHEILSFLLSRNIDFFYSILKILKALLFLLENFVPLQGPLLAVELKILCTEFSHLFNFVLDDNRAVDDNLLFLGKTYQLFQLKFSFSSMCYSLNLFQSENSANPTDVKSFTRKRTKK